MKALDVLAYEISSGPIRFFACADPFYEYAEVNSFDVLIVSASGIGHCFGLFPRPARCGASASLRASGLRSPKEFQDTRKRGSLKFFGPTAKSGPLAWERNPSLRVPRYTGQKGSKTCIRI